MIINKDSLRRDVIAIIKEIDAQIVEVKEQASEMGIPPQKMRDGNANFVMVPLLLAKAQAYGSLIQLQS